MAELAHFKNFAKLKDTSVEFNDITVLAGKPGTGKSYVMKSAYSLEEAIVLSVNNVPTKELNNLSFNMKNMLQSVFTSLSQLSNHFTLNYKDIEIDVKDTNLIVDIKKNQDILLTSNMVFVETPLILEFYKHMDKRKNKTPYHIESLLNILDEDYSFTDEEQDKFMKEFSQKVNTIIGGDIKNRNGSFVYSRNSDKDYNIFNASSGIKSIGLLQYLVTNKALKKGSVLFWEEPEVHLHPSWQLKMVDLFVELMNAGVKIVFSTHSPFMADYLNAISQKNGYRERISFNVLDEKDGVVENHILDEDSWHILQSELM